MAGTLYVVATPIGNLEDLTFRALRILREADLIAAEDTRRTLKLLNHYQIRRPLVSLHAHNERREAPRLVERLRGGASIALVTDAGTPGISDPGAWLVQTARAAGVRISPVPGPSAVAAALSVSGFTGQTFVFLGFPPATSTARAEWFKALAAEPRVIVFFEAPHRVERTFEELKYIKRQILVCREISKINESIGLLEENLENNTNSNIELPAGEFVFVLSAANEGEESNQTSEIDYDSILIIFDFLTNFNRFDDKSIIEALSSLFGTNARAMKNRLKKALISIKQQNAKSS